MAGRLYKKNVLKSPICQRCSNAAENVYHALIGCKQARKVWKLAGFVHLVRQVQNEDIWDVFQNAMLSVSKAEFELLAASMWAIWHARNEFHFSKSISDPSSVLAKAEAMCSSYQRISFQEETAAGSSSEPTVTWWKPPPENWFKLNVDAATNAGKERAGLGAIVRNWKGEIMAAGIQSTDFHGDVEYAEAEAIYFGIKMAIDAGLVPLMVESDSKIAVSLANGRSLKEISWLIGEIKGCMGVKKSFKINHVLRSSNTTAHRLAKYAVSNPSDVIWLEEIPTHVSLFLSSD